MAIERRMSDAQIAGFSDTEKSFNSQAFSADPLGQSYPQQNPHPEDTLGEPLSIHEVAEVIGCSDWTVRHRYLPQGLPHFRSGPAGKFVFFRKQVIAWILQQQRKGGR